MRIFYSMYIIHYLPYARQFNAVVYPMVGHVGHRPAQMFSVPFHSRSIYSNRIVKYSQTLY